MLDKLEAIQARPINCDVWRVVRSGRDPCQGSASGGRWDDRTFDVLYTSLEKDGAIAEAKFHASRGQPVIPSKIKSSIFQLRVQTKRTIWFDNLGQLSEIGLDITAYGQFSYFERGGEYPRSQEIAEHCHFLGFDSIVVPNARFSCLNVVLFSERIEPECLEMIGECGEVNWND